MIRNDQVMQFSDDNQGLNQLHRIYAVQAWRHL
jgi:hypothetical protein